MSETAGFRDDEGRLHFREPRNVPDVLKRDELVRRVRRIRDESVQNKRDIEHWNALNPDQPPLSTAFEDKMIAWCDGQGPEVTLRDLIDATPPP